MADQKTLALRVGGAPDLKAARHFLRGRRPGDHGRLYRAYVVALCTVFFGAPSVWSAAGLFAQFCQAVGAGSILFSLHLAGSVLVALTAFAPSHAGLVVPTARELFYFIEGPFGVRGTLQARTLLLFASVAAAGGLVFAVASAGLGLEPMPAAASVASGLGLGGVAAGSLVLTQTTNAGTGRWAFGTVGAFLVVGSVLFSGSGMAVLSCLELTAAVALGVAVPRFLDRVSIGRLEADLGARATLAAGLMAGDARALGTARAGRARRFRRVRPAFGAGAWPRILHADALSLVRTPARSAAAPLAGIACGALSAATGGHLLATAVALVVLERAFGVLAKGLMDYTDTVGADRIGPDPFWSAAGRHAVLPLILLAASISAWASSGPPRGRRPVSTGRLHWSCR